MADWFDVVGLDPETNYTLEFVTHYGAQQSDPALLTFVTNQQEAEKLTVGAIAGIGISVVCKYT